MFVSALAVCVGNGGEALSNRRQMRRPEALECGLRRSDFGDRRIEVTQVNEGIRPRCQDERNQVGNPLAFRRLQRRAQLSHSFSAATVLDQVDREIAPGTSNLNPIA
jgi:hypothetical protein